MLVEHFVRKHAQRVGKRIDRLEGRALKVLQACEWPGNVRELENMIERTVVLSTVPVVRVRLLSVVGVPTTQPAGLPSLNLHQNLEWVEHETVRRALESACGVKQGRGRTDGPKPARAQLLPDQASHRVGSSSCSSTRGYT